MSRLFTCILLGLLAISVGCSDRDAPQKITMWHQMLVGERVVLQELIDEYNESQLEKPKEDRVEVTALYKETEELRSSFQAAALAGTGPDLVFGPSDAVGAFVAMGIVKDMRPWFNQWGDRDDFLEAGLTFLADESNPDDPVLYQIGDRIGNHLALVLNKKLLPPGTEPPTTTVELVELAKKTTLDFDNDGRTDQYGLVWNFVEPFFLVPFLTGHGAWVFDESGQPVPDLNTPECIAALEFVLALQDEHRVLPANCDYETADALFKDGAAAMIINGDWSWGDYLNLENKDIDAVIAPLPVVSTTDLPMGPMVATKGYSLNGKKPLSDDETRRVMDFVEFMTSAETQEKFMSRLKTLPSRKSLLDHPLLQSDPTLRASADQMKNGRAMPVVPELRAIWDSMRPPYQALLASNTTAKDAAAKMQADAESMIERMNQSLTPSGNVWVLKLLAAVLTLALIWWQRTAWTRFTADWSKNRLAYLFIAPAMLVIIATIVYPFFFNVVLSFSNMSLRNFQDWEITGVQNYVQVYHDTVGSKDKTVEPKLFAVFQKTLIWTFVCVFFHVAIGLLLAVALNGPVRGKSVYRILLILPWAIPSYITALTWRGMFDAEYGAINLLANQYLGLPVVNWLGDPTNALIACIVTNVWLGFPFMMVIALGGMQGIPSELYEAARIDRVPRWKQFWHITLPMLKPVLIPAITLGTIWTFNNINVVWLVSNTGEPSDQTHILVSYVYKAVFNYYQYGYGAALSMVIFFLLLVFSLVFLWRTKATEAVA